jgi:hypothetical protein
VFITGFISSEKNWAAAECYRAGTQNLPLPLRRLYYERRTSAIYQLAFDKAAIDKIEGECLKLIIPVICSSQRVSGACCRYSAVGRASRPRGR